MEITKNTTYGDVTIDSVKASKYQKNGTLTAQLRQVIKTITTYPSTVIGDGVSDNLFDDNEFSLSEGKSYENEETRVTWINVPDTCTIQVLQQRLDNLKAQGKQPCIMKVVSNEPILTDNQKNAIDRGLKTKDDFADKQVVRYGKNSENQGALILDSEGNPMYKRNYFFKDRVEDENHCGVSEVYLSSKIAEELSEHIEQDDIVNLF